MANEKQEKKVEVGGKEEKKTLRGCKKREKRDWAWEQTEKRKGRKKRRIIIESYTDDARVSHKKYTGIYGGKGRASDRGEWIGQDRQTNRQTGTIETEKKKRARRWGGIFTNQSKKKH